MRKTVMTNPDESWWEANELDTCSSDDQDRWHDGWPTTAKKWNWTFESFLEYQWTGKSEILCIYVFEVEWGTFRRGKYRIDPDFVS